MKTSRSLWITLLLLSALVSIFALMDAIPQLQAQNISLTRSKWTLLLGLFALNITIAGIAIWGLFRGWFDSLLARLDSASLSGPWRGAAILGIFILPAAFWIIRLGWLVDILPTLFPSLWIFLWTSLLAALAITVTTRLSFTASFASVVLTQAVLFRVWGILNAVTDFPFTREYSETSRFYYGSLWFSQSLYGMDLPLSTLHPTRYFLQAIPFLVDLPLWAHRLWQSLLWIGLTGAASYFLARRLDLSSKGLAALVAMWGFVYFLQGAVYYHLQICVILILWGVSSKHPTRSFMVVLLASLWAGMSRVNWFPVPAMLAIAIYLLEEPIKPVPQHSCCPWLKYLARPALWTITGLSAALLSQTLYIFWSGNANNASDFSTAFTSDLIWSRLLPNATYPMGVLPGILLVSAPAILALIFMGKRVAQVSKLGLLGISSMLAVLFLGGLVVSTKIGGGGDLHNMDAYLVLLALIVTSVVSECGLQSANLQTGSLHSALPQWVLALAVLIPAALSIGGVNPLFTYDRAQAQKDLDQLRALVEPVVAEGGEVLFISERHLVTFNMIEGVQLVPDYEVVTLMEMAMAGNQAYLDRFTSDLASHRFALVVSRRQRIVKKEGEPFAEENNVWIDSISTPLLCYYQRGPTLESSNTLILTPSETPCQ